MPDRTESCLAEYAAKGESFVRGELAMRKLCIRNLQKKITGRYESYLEPLGGIGLDAQTFQVDPAQTYVNDIDPECLKVLQSKFRNVTSYDFFDPAQRAELYGVQPDVIFVDFNDFTLFKFASGEYRVETLDTFAAAQTFSILNDCTPCYLRQFGRRSYERISRLLGKEITSVDEYFAALVPYYHEKMDWHLTDVEHFYWASPKGNGASSYQLFRKTPQPLSVHFNPQKVSMSGGNIRCIACGSKPR